MKPLIGIVSLYDETKESYWMLPGYVEGLEEAGAASVILPLTTDKQALTRFADLCDGFLFTGGQDIEPTLYGAEKTEKCGAVCRERDNMEKLFFPMALETGKPMLGICRGAQLFNVMLGGDLYQDIPTERPSPVVHHGLPPYEQPDHTVTVMRDSPLFQAVEASEMPVNSYHHQGVRKLGKGLKIAAEAPDGLPEAVYLPERRFAMGVQWHPEFSCHSDENSRRLFRFFVKACE